MQENCKPLDFHKANISIAQTDENRDSFHIIKCVALTPSFLGLRIQNLVANK